MINLYLLKYNNYYNRKIKKEAGIGNYGDYILAAFQNIYTFDYADGVNTSHVLPYKGETPDYAIVTEEDESGIEEIKSRWFVVESSYIRGGKYRVSLRRDLIADNLDEVLDAPCMVEKGYINYPESDDSIFNDEGQSYNQIKVNEDLLFDKSKCPWIVGYLNQGAINDIKGKSIEASLTISDGTNSDINVEVLPSISDLPYWEFMDVNPNAKEYHGAIDNASPMVEIAALASTWQRVPVFKGYTLFEFAKYGPAAVSPTAFGIKYTGVPATGWIKDINAGFYSSVDGPALTNKFLGKAGGVGESITIYKQCRQQINELINYISREHIYDDAFDIIYTKVQNKIYKVGTEYFKIEVEKIPLDDYNEYKYIEQWAPKSYNDIILTKIPDYIQYTTEQAVLYKWWYQGASFKLKKIGPKISTTIPSTIPILEDNSYSMFCMPYGNIPIYNGNAETPELITNKLYNLIIASSISSSIGTSSVIDIQILPYCPFQQYLRDGGINSRYIFKNTITITENDKSTNVGYMFWCKDSSFTFDIERTLEIKNYKEESQLDLYRLSDPSHTQVFEFNAAKNGGIFNFHVQCTYKPFDPYINIHPTFNRLYGRDYDDSRGLICGGDYSLPINSNAWTDYTYRNKNYQNTFNREIQSMELSNKIQKKADIVNATANTINAGLQGMIGAGDPLGSLAAIPAGFGGAMDVKYKEMLRNDQIDKTKTLFNYNLQNIQALPNSISKSNPYNIDNKYVPYLEKYTCSDVEREAFKLKMKYDGMTIMRTGTLRYFLNYKDEVEESYIKGAIIRFPNLSEDYNYAKELSNEVGQGFYLDRRWY